MEHIHLTRIGVRTEPGFKQWVNCTPNNGVCTFGRADFFNGEEQFIKSVMHINREMLQFQSDYTITSGPLALAFAILDENGALIDSSVQAVQSNSILLIPTHALTQKERSEKTAIVHIMQREWKDWFAHSRPHTSCIAYSIQRYGTTRHQIAVAQRRDAERAFRTMGERAIDVRPVSDDLFEKDEDAQPSSSHVVSPTAKYTCKDCGKTYKTIGHYIRHLRNKH